MSKAVYLNPESRTWTSARKSQAGTSAQVLSFHRTLPDYAETSLRALPDLAASLGLGHVLLKDESARFSLPAFKILGASWAVYRAVAARLGLVADHGAESGVSISIQDLGARAKNAGIRLLTATEGNCGRAVARMAAYMGIPVRVYVPGFMAEATRAAIRGEGAEVVVLDGSYDELIPALWAEAESDGNALLVLDVSFGNYETIPSYFVEGYSTMLAESERQVLDATGGKPATHAVVPCGAGSIAQAVTEHFKSAERTERLGGASVVAVEPTTAACLMASLRAGRPVTIDTGDTICCGMNCGTLSTTAWPVLQAGIDASAVVEDAESHRAVLELKDRDVLAGPCGAAALAALKRVCADAKADLGLDESSVVVLFCTEGPRDCRASFRSCLRACRFPSALFSSVTFKFPPALSLWYTLKLFRLFLDTKYGSWTFCAGRGDATDGALCVKEEAEDGESVGAAGASAGGVVSEGDVENVRFRMGRTNLIGVRMTEAVGAAAGRSALQIMAAGF
ncbi:hypothetical protein DL766_009443 [Monosporascus sp. MC13-8B]|uniref:Tryptophan synthase beta chain-like PALP domain-containing protein n=1 Tax=Monosporascus cannonballus TaxID=155416 RepID=A0ABY0HKJ3_9PEZI|nr:hypothetical protein DL762_000146 [Monosporascus cannonballus]RYO99319.1 hypothetical protein DL763_001598 [Monosporascus cannonballus]RYP15268.1 hypothetical protein DL766_009443 [Monosporascus sp. MC13-8B]